MTFRSAHLLTITAITLLACHQRAPAKDELPGIAEHIEVRVENRNRLDVMVYVEHGGLRTRLGLATASTNTEFRISLATLGAGADYRLVGHPLGMRINVYTESLHARPGDEVTWSLEDSFARSTVVVR